MSSSHRLVLGTQNPGKVEELQSLLSNLDIELVSAAALQNPPDVDEDKDTLAGNAQKKAEAFHEHTGLPALSDDTGLEVAALDGRPGVRTARFAGPDATPEDNKKHLLDVLDGIEDRRAQFRTVVALVNENGELRTFEGVCRGTITTEPRGDGGFGYDPLFLPDGHDQTFAEMAPETKNKISHRRNALDAFRQFLVNGE